MSYTKVADIPLDAVDELLGMALNGEWKVRPDSYNTQQNVDVSDIEWLQNYWDIHDWHGAMFICIPPAGHIPPHTESCGVSVGERGPWRKFHIPLQTNPQAISCIGNEAHRLEVGSVYEIDFKRRHESFNHGDTDRIHLVMEIYE